MLVLHYVMTGDTEDRNDLILSLTNLWFTWVGQLYIEMKARVSDEDIEAARIPYLVVKKVRQK